MALHEAERLQALRHLRLLDTAASEGFDRITRMAARLFDVPIAAVSLTDHDRQWFKSKVGIFHDTLPRNGAPCSEVAVTASALVIPDIREHETYADSNLAASGMRYYAGAPLVTRAGYGLGALCVLGREARATTPDEVCALSDLAAMVMAQIELQHAYGRIDPISGLANRNQFLEDLEDLSRTDVAQQRMVVLIDLGRTEQVAGLTGAQGTIALDELVAEVARMTEAELGSGRTLYHVGATQFAFLASLGTNQSLYLPHLVERVKHMRAHAKARFVMTPALGVVPFNPSLMSSAEVLRMAYGAVQVAHGREDGVSVYSEAYDADHTRRHALLQDFGQALETPGELRLVFQPRLDLATGLCVGAEALLRWHHPKLGAVSPGEFVPLVEQSSLIGPMTDWVLHSAFSQLAQWRRDGLLIDISVNVAATNLEDAAFTSDFARLLDAYDLPSSAVEIEITEGTVMGNTPRVLTSLETLRASGVRISIDDFGTGYSSLSYLRRLPIDVVKIDQSFVRNMSSDLRDLKLIRSMILLSQDLGYGVVAEGVETESDAAQLLAMGCDEAQGYFFARPMEADQILEWSRARGTSRRNDPS